MTRNFFMSLYLGAIALMGFSSSYSYAAQGAKPKAYTLQKRNPKPLLSRTVQTKHHLSHSHCSSDCRGHDLPNANKIKAPPFISLKHGRPVMKVAVLNRSCKVNSRVLKKVLKVVSKQVKEDFAPFYGIYVDFKIVRNENFVNWNKNVPLIITDYLPESGNCCCISYHSVQSYDGNGFPIEEAVFDPPPIPIGSPYIVVPIGDCDTCYGIVPVFKQELCFFPSCFKDFFSLAVSHEVLETLHNYTLNLNTIDVSGDFFGPETMVAFSREVCDPVEYSKGYKLCGMNVANFVLPSYWVNDLEVGPFDFLDTVCEPFIPYAGEQDLILFFPCAAFELFIDSCPPCICDPCDLYVSGYPIWYCDGATATTDKTNNLPKFMKGKNAPTSITLINSPFKAGSRISAFKSYKKPAELPNREAA